MRKSWFFFFCIYIVSILILGLFFTYKLGIELKYEQDNQTEFVPLESPQKHLIVGDVVSTTEEFWKWKGDTTSFTAYVINVSNDGNLYLKIKDGSWKGQNGNNYTLNEYWVEKRWHANESDYTGWYWP